MQAEQQVYPKRIQKRLITVILNPDSSPVNKASPPHFYKRNAWKLIRYYILLVWCTSICKTFEQLYLLNIFTKFTYSFKLKALQLLAFFLFNSSCCIGKPIFIMGDASRVRMNPKQLFVIHAV